MVAAKTGLPKTIVSGGQTGVDRAALDVARALGLSCGGWCPRGRRAEDGPIAEHYPMRETADADYGERTRLNVRDSDGTLVLTRGPPSGGTAATIAVARDLERPVLVIDLAEPGPRAAEHVRTWIAQQSTAVLNVAGPRESTLPGIYAEAARFLRTVLDPGWST